MKTYQPVQLTFTQFLLQKYPLYADVDFKDINIKWSVAIQEFEEYLKLYPPIVTVEMHEPESIEPIWMVDVEEQNNMHRVHENLTFHEPVKHTQTNHYHTNG